MWIFVSMSSKILSVPGVCFGEKDIHYLRHLLADQRHCFL